MMHDHKLIKKCQQTGCIWSFHKREVAMKYTLCKLCDITLGHLGVSEENKAACFLYVVIFKL